MTGTSRTASLALIVLILGCSEAEPPARAPRPTATARFAVIQRVDGAAGQTAEPLKLETHTRDAIALRAGESFEILLEEPVRAVVFSIGASASAPVGFAIQARAGERWVRVFEAELEAGEPQWHDRRLGPDQLPPAARRLR